MSNCVDIDFRQSILIDQGIVAASLEDLCAQAFGCSGLDTKSLREWIDGVEIA